MERRFTGADRAGNYFDEDGLSQELFQTNPREDQILALKSRSSIFDLDDLITKSVTEGIVNDAVHKGMRPLHFAVYQNRVDVVNFLIANGAAVQVSDEVGYTPVHVAAIFGRSDCLAPLIGAGALVANPTAERPSDVTLAEEPIRLAVKGGHVDCVRILLENGARPDNQYFRGRELNVIDPDELDIIELLLKHGADPDVYDRFGLTPLMKACKLQKIKTVELLIRYGANVDARSEQADKKSVFHWALRSEEVTLVLLRHGADWTQPFNQHGRYNNVVVIMVAKAYVSCLQEVLTRDQCAALGATVARRFNVNDLYQFRTPLGWLCTQETWAPAHYQLLTLLLAHGADANFGCIRLESPLLSYMRVMRDKTSISVIRTLLNHGAIVSMLAPDNVVFNLLALDFSKWSQPVGARLAHLLLDAVLDIDVEAIVGRFVPYVQEQSRQYILHTVTRPRCLKHLARLAIRRSLLLHRRSLPDDLVALGPLPPHLHEYLLLEH